MKHIDEDDEEFCSYRRQNPAGLKMRSDGILKESINFLL